VLLDQREVFAIVLVSVYCIIGPGGPLQAKGTEGMTCHLQQVTLLVASVIGVCSVIAWTILFV
jgi:hypothetical protein